MQGKCDVCGIETDIYVCASSMGALSLGYCKDCLREGLEPYEIMVSYIACAGHYPKDINEDYQRYVRHILVGLNKTEDQFIKDVEKCIGEMQEGGWMVSLCP